MTISKSSTNLLECGYEKGLLSLSVYSHYHPHLHNWNEVWPGNRTDKQDGRFPAEDNPATDNHHAHSAYRPDLIHHIHP